MQPSEQEALTAFRMAARELVLTLQPVYDLLKVRRQLSVALTVDYRLIPLARVCSCCQSAAELESSCRHTGVWICQPPAAKQHVQLLSQRYSDRCPKTQECLKFQSRTERLLADLHSLLMPLTVRGGSCTLDHACGQVLGSSDSTLLLACSESEAAGSKALRRQLRAAKLRRHQQG